MIGYARISTPSQSLEFQMGRLRRWASLHDADIEIYSEAVSGKFTTRYKRPKLFEAVERAKAEGCPIIVIQPDRVSRVYDFGRGIIDEVDFIFIDYPEADKAEIIEMFRQAQVEREKLSMRVREALYQKKLSFVENLIDEGEDPYYAIATWKQLYASKKIKKMSNEEFADLVSLLSPDIWIDGDNPAKEDVFNLIEKIENFVDFPGRQDSERIVRAMKRKREHLYNKVLQMINY